MFDMSALELADSIKTKKISVIEAVNAYIDQIEKIDVRLNAFITVPKEKALERAETIQKQIDAGETLSPLAGVPIALKDNITTKDIRTTCASKMLERYTPVYNATIVERLEQ